jgi:biopolymer transport protein TolQ
MWIQGQTDFILLLQDTGGVARAVLTVLLIFSIWSWAIILSKSLLLRKVSRESDVFWRIFRKGQTVSEISTAGETLRFTPLVPVFNAGAEAMKPRSGVVTVQRAMQRAATAQLTNLESRLIFLATTASVTPFIGLFGTVWGVLTSFLGLANAGSTTLKAVAPGIAEALITTAFGLLAAIPAVIAYNHFVHRIRNIGGQLDELQSEVLELTERSAH